MKARRPARTHYSLLHEMLASSTEPLPQGYRRHQLTRMYGGLEEIAHAATPGTDSWRVLSDAVNLIETLVICGDKPEVAPGGKVIGSHWRGCDGAPVEVRDADGLIRDAVTALAHAGQRHTQGKAIRLDGPGLAAARSALESYAALLDALPARTMIRCHRLTEQRLVKVFNRLGSAPDGVHVVAV